MKSNIRLTLDLVISQQTSPNLRYRCHRTVSYSYTRKFKEMATGGADYDSIGDSSSQHSKSEMTVYEKLEQAKEYKLTGNDKYKAKAYKVAINKYHRALLYIKGIESGKSNPFATLYGVESSEKELPEDVKLKVQQLKVDCYNNLAACLLQSENPNYEKVVQYCDNVLELDPEKVKAMYRKAVAHYKLRHVDRALELLIQAQALPDGKKDANIQKYLSICQKEMEQQDKKMKQTYKTIFDKLGEENKEKILE